MGFVGLIRLDANISAEMDLNIIHSLYLPGL